MEECSELILVVQNSMKEIKPIVCSMKQPIQLSKQKNTEQLSKTKWYSSELTKMKQILYKLTTNNQRLQNMGNHLDLQIKNRSLVQVFTKRERLARLQLLVDELEEEKQKFKSEEELQKEYKLLQFSQRAFDILYQVFRKMKQMTVAWDVCQNLLQRNSLSLQMQQNLRSLSQSAREVEELEEEYIQHVENFTEENEFKELVDTKVTSHFTHIKMQMQNQIGSMKKALQQLEVKEKQLQQQKQQHEKPKPPHQNQQQWLKLSELSKEQHDELLLYKIFDNRQLEEEICNKLPITDIKTGMKKYLQTEINAVEGITDCRGNYASVMKFLIIAASKKIKPGWSAQLLQILDKMKMMELKQLLCPNQKDLDEFNKRIGVPRSSLLDNISEKLQEVCGVLRCPMGRPDTNEDSEKVPFIYPMLFASNKFNKLIGISKDQSEDNYTDFDDIQRVSVRDLIGNVTSIKIGGSGEKTSVTTIRSRRKDRLKKKGKKQRKNKNNSSNQQLLTTRSNDQPPEFANETSAKLRKKHEISILLVGGAGSGKTTIAKRMVKTYNDENKIAFYIHLPTVGNNKHWSLKDLLFKFPLLLYNLSENKFHPGFEYDFAWVLSNQEKCMLVLDGLDEIEFKITSPSSLPDINDQLPLGELLGLLFSRHFLPKIRLMATCRPSSITQFAHVIEQDSAVISVDHFSEESVETLMKHYIRPEDLKQVWEVLEFKSHRIYQLIRTPLFFRIFVMLYKESGSQVLSFIKTTANLFSEAIKIHKDSANFAKQDAIGIEDLNFSLGNMAYKKITAESSLCEEKDFVENGLNPDDVEDFMFSIFQKPSDPQASAVKLWRFHHLSVQEYLSAEFAVKELSISDFDEFVKKLFPRIHTNIDGRIEVREDKFMNIRTFTFGCINESSSWEKKNILIQNLCIHLRQIFVKTITSSVEEHQHLMMKDMMDFTQDDIVEKIREKLKSFNFNIWFQHFDSNNMGRTEALKYFIGKFVTNVECLNLVKIMNDSSQIQNIFNLIKIIRGKVEEVQIRMVIDSERSTSVPHVEDIISLFPKISRKMVIKVADHNSNEIVDVEAQREFWKEFNQKIQKFDTTTLQTETLELCLRSRRLLFNSTLHRGKTPSRINGIAWSADFQEYLFKLD